MYKIFRNIVVDSSYTKDSAVSITIMVFVIITCPGAVTERDQE